MSEVTEAMIKGLHADLIQADYPGTNTSGLVAFGANVLVRADECAATTGGGIIRLDAEVERLTAAAETGCIFDVGPAAFARFADGRPWVGNTPRVGDRIYFEKYAGLVARGKDGALYRIMSDSCIAAGLDPTVTVKATAA